MSLDAILSELDAAEENRAAAASVAVFSTAEVAPIATPFAYFGNEAIVVLEKEDGDLTALRLATMWARWVVRRDQAAPDGEVDVEVIGRLIDEIAAALARHTTIKRCHSTARNSIDQATRQTSDLVAEIKGLIDQLHEELD